MTVISRNKLLLVALAVFMAGGVFAQTNSGPEGNFDARIDYNQSFEAEPTTDQLQAESDQRIVTPELQVSYSRSFGTARTVWNRDGFLSEGQPDFNAQARATEFINDYRELLGLAPSDLDLEFTDEVRTPGDHITHVYARQLGPGGIPVYNGQLQVTMNAAGQLQAINNNAVAQLADSVNSVGPDLAAADALRGAAENLGIVLTGSPEVVSDPDPDDPQQTTRLQATELSSQEIEARLLYLPIRAGEVRLVWNFVVHVPDAIDIFEFNVDALSGQAWTRFNFVVSETYLVYEIPVESPNHTIPLPPQDARTTAVDPFDPAASPLGWHDTGTNNYTIMRGNNVHAYEDSDANNAPPAVEPDCGEGLDCSFPLDLSNAPSTYRPAAVANLFYWNNLSHDIFYRYGFDELAGNFQTNNFGNGGAGNDAVNAEAQDGGGTCNANFSTPPDGFPGRMQMYICGNRDGDLDNGVVVHEYGHGVSNRLVGGPGNVGCLQNTQQPGEGWSDWLALALTVEPGDQGTDKRGMGTYLVGQPPDGVGIRAQPYSTDPAINSYDYESIIFLGVPHNLGSVWAQVIWEGFWAMVDRHGLGDIADPPDISNPSAWAGNQRMLLYVMRGMQNTVCSPTFVDTRDAVIQAAQNFAGGEDVCPLWSVFANFGLGVDADPGGPNSKNVTNGFEMPEECLAGKPTVTITAPEGGSEFEFGAPVEFTGTANDDEDGDLSDSIEWSSDLDGPLGTGATLTVDTLSVGDHTITASVTDSDGLSASYSIGISILTPLGTCVVESLDFDDGNAGGWNNSPASTCTAGDFVVGVPNFVSNNGVTTQPNGDHTTGSSNAFFTAPNTSAGEIDVDGGNCTATSPVYPVREESEIALWYFAGQRDAGDDPSGDFIRVEMSQDGGTTWSTLAAHADVTVNAVWTEVTATVPADTQVQFRIQASDGPGPGDLIEAGIDDISICPTGGPGNLPPTASFTAVPTSGEAPLDVTFDASGSSDPDGTIVSYDWDFGDGDTGTGVTPPVHTYTAPGSYTAELTVTDDDGATDTTSTVITVTAEPNLPPTASFTAVPTSGEAPLDVTFDASGSSDPDGTIVSYDWDFGDGDTGTGVTPPVHTYASAGSYTAELTVTDDDGATDTTSTVITVTDPPGGCALELLDFDDGNAGGWNNSPAKTCTTGDFVVGVPNLVVSSGVTTQPNGDHTTGSGNAFYTAFNTSAGVDDVDNGACIATSPVYSVTEASEASLWYFAGQRDAGDDPSGDFIRVELSTDGGATWSPMAAHGDVTVNAAWTEVTATIPAGSDAQFRVRASDGPGPGDLIEAGIDDISICPTGAPGNLPPTASFTAVPTSGEAPLDVTFDASGSSDPDGTIVSYDWDFGDGDTGTGVTPPVHTYTAPGSYTAELTVTDDDGATDTTSTVITVTAPPGGCTLEPLDFDDGDAGGWIHSGASTCTTGQFVVGVPNFVSNNGVITQPNGDHTTGSSNAFFTAPNTSAGVDDVDNGNCIATSPVYSVTEDSEAALWYFAGQRDAFDDPSGDFIKVEMSLNGGTTWNTLASHGDVTVNAQWTEVTANIPAGSQVQFKVEASDGPGPGDLVEAGIDDISICPLP